MAEETGVHPGSWVGDSVEEFKKAPIGVKIAIGGALVLAAGIGYYEYSKNKTSSSGISGSASPSTDLTGSGGGGVQSYSTVPGGNTGTVPVLPPGLQPLFDAAGNLIGFEPISTPTTTPPTGGTTKPPTGGGTGSKKKKPPKKTGGGSTSKGGGHTTTSGSGHSTHKTPSGTHTVKSKQGNTKQPVVSHGGGHTKAPSRSIQPHNTGGSHGYVYTVKPGDTLATLQNKFFPTSNTSNKQGNLMQYGNNSKILKQKGVVNPKTGGLKPGTKILA